MSSTFREQLVLANNGDDGYPTVLRRIKPMPKRRRTSVDAGNGYPHEHAGPGAAGVLADDGRAFEGYYATGVPDATATHHNNNNEEDETADGDYIDHLQQPNNTKKRKVPTAPHQAHPPGSGGGPDDLAGGGPGAGSGEPMQQQAQMYLHHHRKDAGTALDDPPRPRVSAATIAGLQHKEFVKRRRGVLATVLNAVGATDELALDQALGAQYPGVAGSMTTPRPADYIQGKGSGRRYLHYRTHHQHRRRRVLAPVQPQSLSQVQTTQLPEVDFTFKCHSLSSDRSITVRDERLLLSTRFEAELNRQAARAAEAARQSQLALAAASAAAAAASNENASNVSTGGKRTAAAAAARTNAPARQPSAVDPPAAPAAKGRQKKKKRSALANASNPHHLRNYVPSRLPHSGAPITAQQQAAHQANYLGPPPIRFLTAEVPAKRRKKVETNGQQQQRRSPSPSPPPAPPGTNPAEEWICPFCEYNLFYGDDGAFRRAVKSRKKILQRRRRARERAAAAASGVAPANVPPPAQNNQGEDAPLVAAAAHAAAAPPAVDASKGLPKRDRDKGIAGTGAV